MVDMLLRDLKFALRLLARKPGFAAIAIVTIALGIGANTAVFSLVQGVLLAPLPYPQPQGLVSLHSRTRDFAMSSISYPNFLDWQRRAHSFSGMAAYKNDGYVAAAAGSGAQPAQLLGQDVSANFFNVLGVHLLFGPGFSAAEDRAGGAPEVVLSYGLWQKRFGGDPSLVGRQIPLNGASYAVVGILPKNFWFWDQNQLFTLVGQWNAKELYDRQDNPGLRAVARLRPGVSLAVARVEMDAIGRQLAAEYPKADAGEGVDTRALKTALVGGNTQTMLLLLLGAVGLVLLIACANVANLLLARASGRRRELALRSALGAGGGRIVRQLLTESVLLGSLGGVLGVGLAALAVRAAPVWLAPMGLTGLDRIGLSLWVLVFTAAAAVGCGLLFGLLPAWQAWRQDIHAALKEGGRSATGSSHRTQHTLAVAEMALALMLLAGTGLMLRSLMWLGRVHLGLQPDRVLTLQFAMAPRLQNDAQGIATELDALLARVRAVPAVASAAETSLLPLGQSDSETSFWLGAGPQPPADKMHSAMFFITSPGYLETMGIPLLRGRFFASGDQRNAPPVVAIDTTLARDIFPGRDPVGQTLNLGPLGEVRIVGVVGHVKFWGPMQMPMIHDQLYFPVDQVPMAYMVGAGQGVTLVARTRGRPEAALAVIRRAVAGPQNDQPVSQVASMNDVIAASRATQRLLLWLIGGFALLAVALAAIGVYGVLAYAVQQRTGEIGVRMALGAAPGRLLRETLGGGLRLAAVGAAVGVAGALLTTRLLASNLYGVSATDPVTLAGAVVLLLAIAALASYLPARRAARVDPMVALRES